MLILIGGEKGGSGKSCIAQNISVLLRQSGKEVLLIDCDPQRTTSDWIQERKENKELTPIECIQLYGNIFDTLEQLKKKYNTIVVDCGGHDSKAFRSCLVSCSHALFPLRPKRRDLKTLLHLEELISESKITNKLLKYSVVINQAPALPSQFKRIEEAKSICGSWGIPCLNSVLTYRNVYDDSEESGASVIEVKTDEKAIHELTNVVKEFLNIDINSHE